MNISQLEQFQLQLLKSKIEAAQLTFQNAVLSIFRKYNMTDEDQISDTGEILHKPSDPSPATTTLPETNSPA